MASKAEHTSVTRRKYLQQASRTAPIHMAGCVAGVMQAATYEEDGYLVTEPRSEDDGDSLTWDSTSDWEDNQESEDVEIDSGTVRLAPGEPDSLIHDWDAQALSGYDDGDSVDSWPDEAGGDTASGGSPNYRDDGINGHPAVEFDGNNDELDTSDVDVSWPFTMAAVVDLKDDGSQRRFLDRVSGDTTFYWNDGTNWALNSGQGVEGSTDDSMQLLVAISDGNDSSLREEGSETASGDDGGGSISNGIHLGHADGNDHWDGMIGELLIYDEALSGSTLTDEEQRLADKWGISI